MGNSIIPKEVADILEAQIAAGDPSEEGCASKFIASEAVIDEYEQAVRSGRTNLPARENIGLACFWMLFLTDAMKVGDYMETVIRFLTPSLPLPLYGELPKVLAMRKYALQQAVAYATAESNSSKVSTATPGDPEFDLF